MTRTADVVAPMNEEGTKATILKWSKRVGDTVRKDEPLLEIETDKVTVEIPSPASGELLEILKQPDEEVLPGQVLARVRVASDAPTAAAHEEPVPAGISQDSGATQPPPNLSPAVRRLLAERGLSPDDVSGSGRNGRITAEDVVRHAIAGAATKSALPHSPIRKRIAEHMVRSLAEAPHVTTLFEADMTRVLGDRARRGPDFERQGARLTLTAYIVAACARALRSHPQVNATFHDDALELHADANIGVGTALGNDGLIVPVLHRAQDMSLMNIAVRLGQLVSGARAGRLTPADVRGGTFTISNHGVGGSLLAVPIVINQPQVAILGVGKIERRVRVLQVNGEEVIAVRSLGYMTLTIDHRAIDAFQANAFLSTVVSTLEQWPED